MSLLLTPRKLFCERVAPWFIQESKDKAPVLSKTLVGVFLDWVGEGSSVIVFKVPAATQRDEEFVGPIHNARSSAYQFA